MNDLERLVKAGWRLQVDTHWDGKFHAQIYKQKTGSGHHHLGQTISEALFKLDEYVAGRESPALETPVVSNGGMKPTCPNCGHEPCAEWCESVASMRG